MASICHFWRLAPAEFWSLTLEELNALVDYQAEYIRERKRQMKRR